MCVFSVVPTGLPDRNTDIGRPAEVAASHGDLDADGRDRPVDGRTQSDGPDDDAAEHDAERQHDEHDVDERWHGDGPVPGHGLDGDDDLARRLPQRPRSRRLPFVVTLGPGQSD